MEEAKITIPEEERLSNLKGRYEIVICELQCLIRTVQLPALVSIVLALSPVMTVIF